MGAGMLIVAIVVATVSSRHVNRLQAHIERQRRREQRSREDLERLSARLVDVQEQERRALARELHDEVGQALTAVKMDIGIALRGEHLEPRSRNALEEARDLSDLTLRSVRDMSQLLHPSALDDFGLPATLTAYLRNFAQRTGIRAQFTETMNTRLSPRIELCVYRIVQEALNNIAQHSGASVCTVMIRTSTDMLRLLVEDNGRGPDGIRVGHGLGLIGMRERAQALGGTFTISEREGGGTVLTVMLPLETSSETHNADTHDIRRAG